MKRLFSLLPLQIAQALIGLGAIAAFTRLMAPDEFGRYALALTASMLAHTLVFTWAEAAAFRFFAQARLERRLNHHFVTLAVIALGLSGIAALAVSLALLAFNISGDFAALVAFAAASALLRFLTRLARETDRAEQKLARYAAWEAIYLVLGFGAGVAFLTVFDFGAAAPFAGLAAAGLVVLLFDAPALIARVKSGAPERKRAENYLGYGYPLALALAVDLGVQTIARIILATQAGEAELGAYAAAFGLARPLDLLFMSAGAALAPALLAAYEEHGQDIARDIARRNFEIMTALALPAAIGLALVAQPLSALLVGEALASQAARVLPWLALAGLFSGFSLYYWSDAFQLAKRTGERAAIMLAPALLQLALTLPLTRMYGAQGAAMAAAAAAFASAMLLAANGRAHVALPLPLVALGRIVLATLTMAMVVAALPMHDALSFALAVTMGACAYLVTAIALDVLDSHALAAAMARSLRAKLRALILRTDGSHARS